MDPVTVIGTDALAGLRTLPDNSVHAIITSPPYLALRNYGLEPIIWDETTPCDHEWPEPVRIKRHKPDRTNKGHDERGNGLFADRLRGTGEKQPAKAARGEVLTTGGQCLKGCGAWRGCLGLEPTPALYIKHIVDIAREARRVLHPSGTFWFVIGDSYFGDSPVRLRSSESFSENWDQSLTASRGGTRRSAAKWEGIKPKDLVGIPWAVAFALRDDGWWLRVDAIEEVELYCPCGCGFILEEKITRYSPDRDIIWHKPNPMPSSQTDRPTKSHEYVFMLSKCQKYFYDSEAVKEPNKSGPADLKKMLEQRPRIGGKTLNADDHRYAANQNTNIGKKRGVGSGAGRTRRSVWTVATEPLNEEHFAAFPRELVRICMMASTSVYGVCSTCGGPWERVLGDRQRAEGRDSGNKERLVDERDRLNTHLGFNIPWSPTTQATIGWRPTCDCGGAEVFAYGNRREARIRRAIDKRAPSEPIAGALTLFQFEDVETLALVVNMPPWWMDRNPRARYYWQRWQERVKAKFPEVKPAVVLDFCAGSGTTGEVAVELGRHAILIEPKPQYLGMIERRTQTTRGLPLLL
jgi:DNA modification methylase